MKIRKIQEALNECQKSRKKYQIKNHLKAAVIYFDKISFNIYFGGVQYHQGVEKKIEEPFKLGSQSEPEKIERLVESEPEAKTKEQSLKAKKFDPRYKIGDHCSDQRPHKFLDKGNILGRV